MTCSRCGVQRACLENKVLAHDSKVDLTEAGHALNMTHECQQVR